MKGLYHTKPIVVPNGRKYCEHPLQPKQSPVAPALPAPGHVQHGTSGRQRGSESREVVGYQQGADKLGRGGDAEAQLGNTVARCVFLAWPRTIVSS